MTIEATREDYEALSRALGSGFMRGDKVLVKGSVGNKDLVGRIGRVTKVKSLSGDYPTWGPYVVTVVFDNIDSHNIRAEHLENLSK